MKKLKIYLIAIGCLFLVALTLALIFYIVFQDPGIRGLRFYNVGETLYVKIKYFSCAGYRVEPLKTDEMIIIGEREVDPADFMGDKSIVKINLFETDVSDKLKKSYNYFEVYDQTFETLNAKKDIDIKFMLCPSTGHGVCIYVGFEDSFESSVTENSILYKPLDSIVPIGSFNFKLGKIGDG